MREKPSRIGSPVCRFSERQRCCMKKKKTANAIMVLLIVLIAAGGIGLALHLRQENETAFGTAFHRQDIPDNRLTVSDSPALVCTVTIRCDTVFDHVSSLDEAKIPYVPQDGIVLPATTVEITSGETVFSVLQRACEAADLQLEYSWTPIYDSYYVEGISHLYEFDCGMESGWMYKVDGWFPNYGCSSFQLQGGEDILWIYTCEGLGNDVGAERTATE